MHDHETSDATPTLDDVLARREERQRIQRELIEARHLPLVSVTVVSPGPVKSSPLIARVHAEALAELDNRIRDVELWPVWERQDYDGPTGPETLLAVDADPVELKRAMVDLEESHPWGRLWDLDVVTESGPLTRADVDAPARRCLLCKRPSPECARSRRHSVDELVAERDRIVADNPMD